MENTTFQKNKIEHLAKKFAIEGDVLTTKPFGSGHINDTFFIQNIDKSCPDYLLQRINHHIFKDVEGVVVNISRVSAHLGAKLNGEFKTDKSFEQVLTLIPTTEGVLFLEDDDGNFWRMYQFIKDSISYDLITSSKQAYEGGEAFGRFQRMLADMDPNLLKETLKDFHNIKFRLANFYNAVTENCAGRVNEVNEELALIEQHKDFMCSLYEMGEKGLLPKRITHNDTKFNNILFDKNDKVICIIDLDTVMPGYVAYDFGDAIRTLANTAEEDEANLNKIDVNISLFKAYTEGYLKEALVFLTDDEIKSLYLAVFLFPFMQAIRFLTDYLQGDTYYKIAYPSHNLVRTKAQFQLFKKLYAKKEELEKIINDAKNNVLV
ncbi:aminoglycoside phosphotransferase family protein [Pedobacter sp. SD-b]|uniref:Aminoglycoside phosphotransferase family protein n=1 Tax=Pedobacter segetis TaxID=2793069 RepID=A0ABS1BL69_9SPHI|nr:aminoglycoside phosphotransferase family protein [Pedobacter segetis]MBK0383642.1 aminoglycoside phosphotransferase family protein [Pedobacter segetis]